MIKQRTFYEKKGTVINGVTQDYQSALSVANEWIDEVDIPFDVTKIEISLKKKNSWDRYNIATVKIHFV